MKERPILFGAEMVRAILEGRKTQTRRVVKPQPIAEENGWFRWGYLYGAPKASSPRRAFWHGNTWYREQGTAPIDQYCPYGQPGDRLWVRETWAPNGDTGAVWYRAGVPEYQSGVSTGKWLDWPYKTWASGDPPDTIKWSPSTYMPRWASRLTLEITGVRVERVQDISEDDAEAEGAQAWDGRIYPRAVLAFKYLWNSINTKRGYGWDVNPWVWVIEFRSID